MKVHDELLGADLTEHLIRHQGVGVSRVLSALINQQHNEHQILSLQNITVVGKNTGTSFNSLVSLISNNFRL